MPVKAEKVGEMPEGLGGFITRTTRRSAPRSVAVRIPMF
jgi:hypothetical protein